MDEQENPLERDHSLSVVLPGGTEKNATVHGSKPVMDLLVTLCASYHLNPSDYTVEFLSTNKNNISFKPNSPVGSLEAEKIVLKPKGVEEKIRRPYMPEATVRLLINYNKSHKAVVRVNPRLPLEMLLPVVCDKCEFRVETTILLRDAQSKEPLDLSRTLNEHGLREVFAKDTAGKEPADHQHQPGTPEAAVTPTEVISPPAPRELPKKKKHKENTGFLSLFRRRKKKTETEGAASAPPSPDLSKQMAAGMDVQGVYSSNTLPADMPKKRRAPQPPMGASQSVPNNLSTCHLGGPQRSAESTLRSTKRRAPPPPQANAHQGAVKGTVDSLNTLDELRESDDSDSVNLSPSSPSSPHPLQTQSSSSSSRPSFEHYLPSFRGKDLSDARSALAKVLTSSVSRGTLVKRLRNSATFPKFYSVSSFASMSPRCPDKGVFCADLESVPKSNLPAEPEWEDPLQRRGMTTFKVVPSKKQKSHDPELSLDVPDQCQVTVEENPESAASPEASLPPEDNRTETEEDSYSPDKSDCETPLPAQELTAQEIQASDGPDSPSPPPPPTPLQESDNQDCTVSPLSEVEDNDEEQKEEEDDPKVTSEVTAAELSDRSDEELTTDGQLDSEGQREFPQSPIGRSASTDENHAGSHTDETGVVEEEEDNFPPPPPPVFFSEHIEVVEGGQEDAPSSSLPSSQPTSPPCNGQSAAFGEARRGEPAAATWVQTPAAPRPLDRISAAPSRFAQAVALAVQRSRLQRHGKTFSPQAPSGPHRALPSPPRSTYQYGA